MILLIIYSNNNIHFDSIHNTLPSITWSGPQLSANWVRENIGSLESISGVVYERRKIIME